MAPETITLTNADGQRYEARLYRDARYGLPCVDITTNGETARTGMLMDRGGFAAWCAEQGLAPVATIAPYGPVTSALCGTQDMAAFFARAATPSRDLTDLSDTDLTAIEEALRKERRDREYIEDLRRYPPSLTTIRDAARMASEWLEPAYIHGGTGFGCTIHMCEPAKETRYRGVVYPDGRMLFCGFAPNKKDRATLATVSAECKADALARARGCLSDSVEEYLWYHGTRMGRRQLRYATTPSGHPWGRERFLPHRVWRHQGWLAPHIRHSFFRMDISGARCLIWRQDGVRYGSPCVLLPGQTSPYEGMGIKGKKKRATKK